jgi:hypothetical protein
MTNKSARALDKRERTKEIKRKKVSSKERNKNSIKQMPNHSEF